MSYNTIITNMQAFGYSGVSLRLTPIHGVELRKKNTIQDFQVKSKSSSKTIHNGFENVAIEGVFFKHQTWSSRS